MADYTPKVNNQIQGQQDQYQQGAQNQFQRMNQEAGMAANSSTAEG